MHWKQTGCFIHLDSKRSLMNLLLFYWSHVPIFILWQWKTKILRVSIWGKTQWYWKCRSSFKLPGKSIWKPKSTTGLSQHRRRTVSGRNTVLLCLPVADRNIFRQCKDKLTLDSYQIRSAQGIRRYWLLMSMAHFMCMAGTGECCSFEKGYHRIGSIIQTEKYQYFF
mgnify:CR=1 FL=1